MIVLDAALLKRIEDAAEAAYPDECCGLLVGRGAAPEPPGGTLVVTRIEASPNVAAGGRRDRFEVDPQVRFDLMRALAGGDQRIIGHYHSHPDHSPRPSERDLEMALEPDLVWLITAVERGCAAATKAHAFDARRHRFREIEIRIADVPGRQNT